MAPTLFTACNALPPEVAAAPAARQSRLRERCWFTKLAGGAHRCSRSFAGSDSLKI